MIFQTERLLVRKLKPSDIDAFHKMQNNPNVMRYTDSPILSYTENIADLNRVISFYKKPNNSFWVYAVVRKKDKAFIGTLAFIDTNNTEIEIGYRYLEEYWNKGYAYEALLGMTKHAKENKMQTLIADVIVKNKASEYLLKKAGFNPVKEYLCEDLNLLERQYKLKL